MRTVHFFTLLVLVLSVFLSSCRKDKEVDTNDYRSVYVGKWNFKSTTYKFSGYYDYSGFTPIWTYSSSTTIGYNDSTGSVRVGPGKDEIILKYCSSCEEKVLDLKYNGLEAWTINETSYFNDVQPAPPGYTSSYTSIYIEGWKL